MVVATAGIQAKHFISLLCVHRVANALLTAALNSIQVIIVWLKHFSIQPLLQIRIDKSSADEKHEILLWERKLTRVACVQRNLFANINNSIHF